MPGLAEESFDFVHSSHCLEHLPDPAAALSRWFRLLRPGCHLVVLVPDEDLYEQGVFPSSFNSDHRWTFTIAKARSWSPRSLNVLDLVRGLGPEAELLKVELLDATYRYDLPRRDQSLGPLAECGIEFVLRRRTAQELAAGGRLPPRS